MIVIIGGGMVGLTLAALLAKNNFSVTLVESKKILPNPTSETARVSTIHLHSQQVLQYLKAWELLDENTYAPLKEMRIWDHTQNAQLQFDSRDIDESEMGFVVNNDAIIAALQKILSVSLDTAVKPRYDVDSQHGVNSDKVDSRYDVDYCCPDFPVDYTRENNNIIVALNSGKKIKADLVIGADGAQSWVRKQMPISMKTRSYQQKAITAVIESEKPHEHCAYQKFLTTGPVALLPLSNPHHTALVWSADIPVSDALMQNTNTDFAHALTTALDFKLGKLKLITERAQFPLTMRHADEYAVDGFVLVGDAAHTIHPLAGLGVNLGIMDAACLTQVLLDARDQKRALNDQRTLRRYTRWRKAENTCIISSMRGLKEVFSIDTPSLAFARSMGVNTIDQCVVIKNRLMQVAIGKSSELPGFLRGNCDVPDQHAARTKRK